MNKIFEKLNSINKFSKNVIITGGIISAAFCLIGLSIITYNKTIAQTVSLYVFGASMIYTAITLFAEFTIGGLVMDLAGTILKNHDD